MADPTFTGSRPRVRRELSTIMGGAFPQKMETWNPGWAPQPIASEPRPATHITSSNESRQGFWPLGSLEPVEWSQSERKPVSVFLFVFKPRTVTTFIGSYSSEVLVEGEWCRLEAPKERLGWEVLGDMEKQQLRVIHSVITLPNSNGHFS